MFVAALDVVEECLGSHHGQTDARLLARRHGVYAGHLDYTVFGEDVTISMVSVPLGLRRQGIAARLVQRLQQMHAGVELRWGMVTPEGHHLFEALPKVAVPDAEVLALRERLDACRREYERLERLRDDFFARGAWSEAEYHDAMTALEPMYQVGHDIDTLELALFGRKDVKMLIQSADPAPVPAPASVRLAHEARRANATAGRPAARATL